MFPKPPSKLPQSHKSCGRVITSKECIEASEKKQREKEEKLRLKEERRIQREEKKRTKVAKQEKKTPVCSSSE